MTLCESRRSYYWNHSSKLDTLVNQDDPAAPIRSPVRGQTGFSKWRGLRSPNVRGPNFVCFIREHLLRRLGFKEALDSKGIINTQKRYDVQPWNALTLHLSLRYVTDKILFTLQV